MRKILCCLLLVLTALLLGTVAMANPAPEATVTHTGRIGTVAQGGSIYRRYSTGYRKK